MGERASFPTTVCLLLGLLWACTAPAPEAPPHGPTKAPRIIAEPALRTLTIGTSVEGRPIRAYDLGSGEDCLLVIASIHGNEGLGTPLSESLVRHLRAHPGLLFGRRVVIVPEANPDGLARGSRRNVNGVDLNRNFPSNNFHAGRGGRTPLSEPEARALKAIIEKIAPDRVVSIHQPLRCVDYDGPALPVAKAMAKACGLRLKKLGARPGSLGSYVGVDLGIPIVTVELPPSGGLIDENALWAKYGNMLLVAVEYETVPRRCKITRFGDNAE